MHGLRSLSSWPIARKLFLLFVAIFLPASGIIVVSNVAQREREIRRAQDAAQLLTLGLAAQQEQIAAGTRQMLSTLAQLPEVRNHDSAACNELFRQLNGNNSTYSFLGAATPDGNVFAYSAHFVPGLNLSDRKYIRDALRTCRFSAGEYVVGRVSKVGSIHFAYPLLDRKKRVSVILIAGVRLDAYTDFVKKANLPPCCTCAITDYKGVRLFRFPESPKICAGTAMPEDLLRRMSGNREVGAFETTSEDGARWIYAYRRLRLHEDSAPYLYIYVGKSRSQIFEAANRDMLRNLSGLGILGLLGMLLVWISANCLLIEPIKRLVETTRHFAKEELEVRTGLPHTSDELGQLAESFDEMGALLEMRRLECLRAKDELQNANGALESKVEIRTAELVQANGRLQQEIGEREKVENALRAALVRAEDEKSRSESIISGMSDCVTILDKDYNVAYQNEICKAKVGNHEGDFCYRGIHGRNEICEDCHVKRCFVDGGVHRKEAGRVTDGRTYYFEITGTPLRNSAGEITGAIEIARDITERQKAEEELKESGSKLADIIDFLPDATFVIDREGRVIAWNRAMEEMPGIRAAAMLGKGDYEYALPFYGERRPILIDLVLEPRGRIRSKV